MSFWDTPITPRKALTWGCLFWIAAFVGCGILAALAGGEV